MQSGSLLYRVMELSRELNHKWNPSLHPCHSRKAFNSLADYIDVMLGYAPHRSQ